MTFWLRVSNYSDTACPLGFLHSEEIFIRFIFDVSYDVGNALPNVILGAAFVVFLVFRIVKLTVSDRT